MATTKKTTKTTAAKKTNDSKAKKTNNTKTTKTNNAKKKVEETNVVDEFLNTVVGETFTEEDADNNENRKKEIKEKADMYAKQAAELIKEAEENEPECLHYIDDEEELTEILTQQINAEGAKSIPEIDTNEPDDEPNEAEKQFDELFEEKKEPEQPVNTNPQIVYVSTAMGASWD